MDGTDRTVDTADEWDDLFLALSASRRRRLLTHLWRHDTPRTVADLATLLADTSETVDDWSPDDAAVRDCRIRLQHVDLPLLDGLGLVEWDRDTGTVALGDRAADFSLFSPLHAGLVGTPAGNVSPSAESPSPEPSAEKGGD